MKKFENLGRKLSKEEQKNIMGGKEELNGACYGCYQYGTHYYSCWYSNRGCEVCTAVYGSNSQCTGIVGCGGCHMNSQE